MLFGQEGTANTSDPDTPDTTILIIALICGSASAFIALISGLNIAKQVETVALEYVMTRYRFMVYYVLCRVQLIRCMYVCLIVLCEFEMISIILCFIIIWLFLLFIFLNVASSHRCSNFATKVGICCAWKVGGAAVFVVWAVKNYEAAPFQWTLSGHISTYRSSASASRRSRLLFASEKLEQVKSFS